MLMHLDVVSVGTSQLSPESGCKWTSGAKEMGATDDTALWKTTKAHKFLGNSSKRLLCEYSCLSDSHVQHSFQNLCAPVFFETRPVHLANHGQFSRSFLESTLKLQTQAAE